MDRNSRVWKWICVNPALASETTWEEVEDPEGGQRLEVGVLD